MLGDNLRIWFEMFEGIVVYVSPENGDHTSDGWINWTAIEHRFKNQKINFIGQPYTGGNSAQRNNLLDAIVCYSNIFVRYKLLEKRRQVLPVSLDYRLTSLGILVGKWGYGCNPGFRKQAFFFLFDLTLKFSRIRKVIALGAFGWAVLNAVKFYSVSLTWIHGPVFAIVSATLITAIASVWIFIKYMIESNR